MHTHCLVHPRRLHWLAALCLLASPLLAGDIQYGQTVQGELTPANSTYPGRGFAETYALSLSASDAANDDIIVEIHSLDFDPFLILTEPDGTVRRNDDYLNDTSRSRLLVAQDSVGDFTITVTSFGSDETGSFTLSVGPATPPDSTLEIGTTLTFELDGSEPIDSDRDSFVDTFTFEADDNTQYSVQLRSDDFDTFLRIVTPSGEEIEDDDGGSGTNSTARLSSGNGGTVTIEATSFNARQRGRFFVRIVAIEEVSEDLPLGEAVSGRLSSEDAVEGGYGYADHYTVVTEPGLATLIDLLAVDSFDTVLIVELPDGRVLTNDDFDRTLGHSRLIVDPAPEARTLTVMVTSYSSGVEGRYSLRASSVSNEIGTVRELDTGSWVGSRLTTDAEMHARFGLTERYELTLEEDQTLTIDLNSTSFDTLLIVELDGEEVARDDDSGSGTNSSLEFTAPESATYHLLVTSFSGDDTGSYRIRATMPQSEGVIGVDSTMEGQLAATDPVERGRGYADYYELTAQEGQFLAVEMRSRRFDTYLMVQFPDGSRVVNDDWESDLRTSRIELELDQTGTYTIIATSYAEGDTGDYTLITSSRAQRGSEILNVTDHLDEAGTPSFSRGYILAYEVDVRGGAELLITLESDAFDAYLGLVDEDGVLIAEDDDSGQGTDARIQRRVRESGVYTILVSSFSQGEAGEFTLRVVVP